MKLLRYVNDAEMAPVGFGLAWYDPLQGRRAVLPVPLNLLAAFARWLYFGLAFRWVPDRYAHRWRQAREQGWGNGYAMGLRQGDIEGRREGWRQAIRFVESEVSVYLPRRDREPAA